MSRKWFGKEMPFRQFPLSLFGLFFPHNTGTTLRDLLKTNEDIASQSRRILQTFVSIVGGPASYPDVSLSRWKCARKGRQEAWGGSSCPPAFNVCKISRFCRAISLLAFNAISPGFKLGKFPNSKPLFPAVSMKICYLVFIKTWKIPWKGLLVIIFYGIFGNSKTGQIFYHLNLSTSWSHTETFFWLVTQFATLETKRELRPKHVPQLFLRSSPVTYRSAIGQFLTVPEVFSKVNSARCPRF